MSQEPSPPARSRAAPSRRSFLRRAAASAIAAAASFGVCTALPRRTDRGRARAAEAPAVLPAGSGALRIVRIRVQQARGRRLTPVAPNAYAGYRGRDVTQTIVRVTTRGGLEGVGVVAGKLEALREPLRSLLGADPHDLVRWEGDFVRGPAERHREVLDRLGGVDEALLDLLGKDLRRPVARLLGEPRRASVTVYDSSLYMEELLEPAQREGLAYLRGPAPEDPAEMVARKALWVLGDDREIRTLKIKIGRGKWIPDAERALDRDVAVVRAVRRAVGTEPVLFVDGNDGFSKRPADALRFAEATSADRLHALEEMFPEERVEEHRALKGKLRHAGIATKLADGENHRGGIPPAILAERLEAGAAADSPPLVDVNQPDMDANGLLRMLAIADETARWGLTLAPHNFASKMGFWAQVHLGLVATAFEFAETDDSGFPGLEAPGIEVRGGKATLAGAPGLGVRVLEDRLEPPLLDLGGG